MPSRQFAYDRLLKKGNKYAITLAVAKRARQLHAGATPLVETTESRPVMIALQELDAGALIGAAGEQEEDELESAEQ